MERLLIGRHYCITIIGLCGCIIQILFIIYILLLFSLNESPDSLISMIFSHCKCAFYMTPWNEILSRHLGHHFMLGAVSFPWPVDWRPGKVIEMLLGSPGTWGQFTLPFGTCGLCTWVLQEEGWRKYQALIPKGKQFSQQNWAYLRLAEELQFRACKLWQTIGKSGGQRKGNFFYRGKGEGLIWRTVHWRKARVWFVVASPWLGCHWAGENLPSLLGYVQ